MASGITGKLLHVDLTTRQTRIARPARGPRSTPT
jgi:hypothetical protein